MADKEYYQFTAGKPLPSRILLHAPDASGPYEKCTNEEFVTSNQAHDGQLYVAQQLGSAWLGLPLNLSPYWFSGFFIPSSGTLYMYALYLPSCTASGIAYSMQAAGAFTASNYNGIGLYQWSGSQFDLIAQTANDGNIWKATAGIISTVNFVTPVTIDAGIYMLAMVYSASAVTTNLNIRAAQLNFNPFSHLAGSPITNHMCASASGVTSLPSSIDSSYTASSGNIVPGLAVI